MDENLHDIDDLFRDSLEGHEEMPPAGVWDAIDKSLDKSSVVAIRKKYDHLKKLAAVLAIVLTATLSWSIYNHISNKKEAAIIENKKTGATNYKDNNNSSNPGLGEIDNSTVVNNNKDSLASGINNGKKEKIISKQQQNIGAANNNGNNKKINSNKIITVGTSGELATASSSHKKANKAIGVSPAEKVTNATIAGNKNAEKNVSSPVASNTDEPVLQSANNNDALEPKANAASVDEPLTTFRSLTFEPLITDHEKADTKVAFYSGKLLLQNNNNSEVAAASFVMPKQKLSRFSVMPFYGIHINSNNVREEDHNGMRPPPDHDRDEIRDAEQQKRSFSYGVLVGVALKDNWSLQSGVSYTERNTSIEPKIVYARPDDNGEVKYRFECSSGYGFISPKTGAMPIIGDSTHAGEASNKLAYINIPLAVNYTIRAGKFRFIPAVGAGFNILVKQQLSTELYTGSTKTMATVNKIEGLKSTYFNGFAGLGLEYALTQKIGINITPAANFGLESINKNAAVKSYSNAFTLNAGLRINF